MSRFLWRKQKKCYTNLVLEGGARDGRYDDLDEDIGDDEVREEDENEAEEATGGKTRVVQRVLHFRLARQLQRKRAQSVS